MGCHIRGLVRCPWPAWAWLPRASDPVAQERGHHRAHSRPLGSGSSGSARGQGPRSLWRKERGARRPQGRGAACRGLCLAPSPSGLSPAPACPPLAGWGGCPHSRPPHSSPRPVLSGPQPGHPSGWTAPPPAWHAANRSQLLRAAHFSTKPSPLHARLKTKCSSVTQAPCSLLQSAQGEQLLRGPWGLGAGGVSVPDAPPPACPARHGGHTRAGQLGSAGGEGRPLSLVSATRLPPSWDRAGAGPSDGGSTPSTRCAGTAETPRHHILAACERDAVVAPGHRARSRGWEPTESCERGNLRAGIQTSHAPRGALLCEPRGAAPTFQMAGATPPTTRQPRFRAGTQNEGREARGDPTESRVRRGVCSPVFAAALLTEAVRCAGPVSVDHMQSICTTSIIRPRKERGPDPCCNPDRPGTWGT